MSASTSIPAAAPTADVLRDRFHLIVLAVVGTPVLAGVGWMAAWQVARLLPGVPNWDGTFTWAPLLLLLLGPGLVLLVVLAAPAWFGWRNPRRLVVARLLVIVGCQALVVFFFGVCPGWWLTGGFPPTWQIVSLELLAGALTLLPSVLLLRRRDDGTLRGWRALAMVAPALIVVLVIAVGSAVHGVPPYDPYPVGLPAAAAPPS